MAQVIDALLVTLGLNSDAFNRGIDAANKKRRELDQTVDRGNQRQQRTDRTIDEANRRRQREAEDRTKRQVEGFKNIRNQVLGLFAIFTAGKGIKDFITDTINSTANLGFMAANLKMSTQDLTAWQLASQRAGGTAEGMTAQLKESSDTLAQLKSGMGPNEGLQWFFRLGGSSDALKDGNTYLLARSKILADMFSVDPGQAALMAKNLGISEDQFNFIKQGPDAVLKMVAAQEKNAVVTEKDAAAALELKNKMLDLRDSLVGTATRIVLQMAPALEKMFARLERGAQWVADHREDIAKWIDTAIVAVVEFVRQADKFANAIGGWKNVLIGLAGLKVLSMAGPLLSLGSALASIGGGLASVIAGAGAVPLLIAAAGAAATYGGYKLAEAVFGDDEEDKPRQMPITVGKQAPAAKLQSIEALRAEAARQRKEAGLPPIVRAAPANGDTARPSVPTKNADNGASEKSKKLFSSLEEKYALPAGLLDSIWATESARGKNMLSGAGAKGHFQFMDGTAKQYGLQDPNNLEQSADAAARMMADLLKKYNGDVPSAAAAYNWGQGNLDKKGIANAPKETRDYMLKIAQGMGSQNAMAAANMPMGAAMSVGGTAGRSSTNTSTTTIENLTVMTQATDAEGMARGIRPSLEKYTFAAQANSGM